VQEADVDMHRMIYHNNSPAVQVSLEQLEVLPLLSDPQLHNAVGFERRQHEISLTTTEMSSMTLSMETISEMM
jgi:hypothetical protein